LFSYFFPSFFFFFFFFFFGNEKMFIFPTNKYYNKTKKHYFSP